MSTNLALPVYVQWRKTPHALALAADGMELSYEQLARRATRFAGALHAHGVGAGARVGILGSRSLVAVESVLGVAWAGASYVPLGLRWPLERLMAVLDRVHIDALVVDQYGLERLTPELLAAAKLLVLPARPDSEGSQAGQHPAVVHIDALPEPARIEAPVAVSPGDLAYVIFTSGTTGVPKGVMAPVGSVRAYFHALGLRKAMTPEDRASQFTDLSFDPSSGEIYLPWYAGASLHVVPPVARMSPARFIREQQLTVWGSAPAAIAWMRDTRSLRPGAFPTLRYSSFGGEPLSLDAVRAWQAAAPNSVVDNLYGPTEATVDCAGQRVEPGAQPLVTPGRGVLAIGTAHPGTELAVLRPDLQTAGIDEPGELAIAGAQLTLGYLDDQDTTAERFRTIDGKRWYLTGDVAMRDASGAFHHLGRIDNQIKFQGHRVELEDIEAHLRVGAQTDQVAAVAWPVADGVAGGIVGFVAGSARQPAAIREALRTSLPPYMVPGVIRALTALPRGAHGKLDRHALIEILETPVHPEPDA